MPSKNIKKGAAALFQNSKEIDRALKHGATCGAVTKSLGFGGFTVQLSHKKSVLAVPRGLFTCGTMRISVGQIVIIVGTDRAEGDSRSALPWEIVARVDDKATAKLLVKNGCMPAEVLNIAASAGMIETPATQEEDDDLFDDDFWEKGQADLKGSAKAERKSREASVSIASRVATLKSGRGKQLDGSVVIGEMTDPALLSDPDYERFKRWRAHKAKAVTMSIGGTVQPMVQPMGQTMAELMAQFKQEAEASAKAEQQRIQEVKEMLEKQSLKENWDDEEVSLADL